MTEDDFDTAVKAFDECESFLCSASLDGGDVIRVRGDAFNVIPMAISIIIETARRSGSKHLHLGTAIALMQSLLISEITKEKRPQRRQPHRA